MNPKHFRYLEEDGVATIRLDRPERLNALTFDSYAELRDTFVALRERDSVRSVIVTGTGRAFCSGGDVKDII
ncbi:MAG: enoyl-CoA hydratase/carnithine racemase, partial [Gammaproteobacteria bacterium]